MGSVFHWARVLMFCYSTENTELLEETMAALLRDNAVRKEAAEGHHGNTMLILSSELTKDRDIKALFTELGKDLTGSIAEELGGCVDEDCVFYLRLDKQKAIFGEYERVHHGDVISLTAKIVSHPARKEIAVARMKDFLTSLF